MKKIKDDGYTITENISKRWFKIIETISQEVIDLIRSREIYLQMQEIIISNNNINKSNRFYDWISKNYGDAAILALRRLVENNSRDKPHSLLVLINDIKENKQIASEKFPDLTENFIETDLKNIEQINRIIKDYADKNIAHKDKNPSKLIPTFNNIYTCINLVEIITKRYYLILTNIDYNLCPIVQDDWKNIFKYPWLE